jgi:hypothetical protein
METPNFPNGFTSWVETHHEIVSAVERMRDQDEMPEGILKIQESRGTGGFYELCEDLTNEFEKLNEGREWDGEFFEEIEDFINLKINEL